MSNTLRCVRFLPIGHRDYPPVFLSTEAATSLTDMPQDLWSGSLGDAEWHADRSTLRRVGAVITLNADGPPTAEEIAAMKRLRAADRTARAT